MGDQLLRERKNFEEVVSRAIQQKVVQSLQGVKEQYLRILRIVHDIGDVLRLIHSYCCNKMCEEAGHRVMSCADEISELKTTFKNESYQFKQFLINEKIVHGPIHKSCNEFLEKFHNIMDRDFFVDICTQLPAIIKRLDQNEIQMIGRVAGDLANDLKENRVEIMKQLDNVSSGSSSENSLQLND